MFTGIVEEVGRIKAIAKGTHFSVLTIEGKVDRDRKSVV